MSSQISKQFISIGPFSMEITPSSIALFTAILTVGFVGIFVLLFILSRKAKTRSARSKR